MDFTTFLDEVYTYRLIYSDNFDITERIIELENKIIENKDKIKIFSSISPGQIIPKENINDTIEWINNEINKILNSIEDSIIEKYKLELYLRFLETNSIEE